jgi:hypothetical protein
MFNNNHQPANGFASVLIHDVKPDCQADVAGLDYKGEVYSCVVANMTSTPFFVFPCAVFPMAPFLVDRFEIKVRGAGFTTASRNMEPGGERLPVWYRGAAARRQ